MKSTDITEAIKARWPAGNGMLIFEELRLGSGYRGIAERRIDLFTLETAPSKGYVATAYEVKISRGDFTRDVRNPIKQRGARLFADKFYFATPVGLVKPGEIPDWAGLIEIDPEKDKWRAVKEIVPAPRLDKPMPSWGLVVSMVRNAKS